MDGSSRSARSLHSPPDPPRAVWFDQAKRVELRAEALPPVGPEDVRIRAVASAISQGTEMLVFRGQVPSGTELDLPTLKGSFEFPIKYGYALVGRVVETGIQVRQLHQGDLVFVHHPHQSEMVVPASIPVKLPASLDPEVGVFVANLETAVTVLLDAAPRLAERVVVFGQGVVGLLLTQLCRRAGASVIITVDPIERRRELSLLMGADVSLPPGEDLAETVKGLTEATGADLAMEASGNPSALQAAMDCLAFKGTVVLCSWYGTKAASLMLGGAFHRGRLRLISSQVGTIDPSLQPRWDRGRRLRTVIDLLPELKLQELISHRYSLAQAAEAFRLVDERPEDTCQVILTYGV